MMASRRVNSGEQLSTVATLISEAQTLDANGDELVSAYSTIEQWVNYDCVCVCVCRVPTDTTSPVWPRWLRHSVVTSRPIKVSVGPVNYSKLGYCPFNTLYSIIIVCMMVDICIINPLRSGDVA